MGKKITLGFIFESIALLFALIAMVGYTIAGKKDGLGFVQAVDIFLILGITFGIIFLIKDFFELGPIISTSFLSLGFGLFINNRFMYYSHLYYGISSDPLSVEMLFATVGFVGMFLFSFIAAFLTWNYNKKEVGKHEL